MSDNDWSGAYNQTLDAAAEQQQKAQWGQILNAYNNPQAGIPNVTVTGSAQPQEPMGVGKAIYEGVKGGVRNSFNAIDDVANWLNDNVINLRTEEQQRMYDQYKQTGVRGYAQDGIDLSPDAPKPKEGVANFAYNTAEFLTGFIPALKAVRGLSGAAALTKAGMIAEGAAAGAGGAFFSLDPNEERLSNMLNDNLPDPLKNPVTDYLAADPNDPALEGRFKNALENAAFGVIGDVALNGIFKAVKAAKSHFVEKGIDPLAALKSASENQVSTTSIKTELDNILTDAGEARASGYKQGEVQISKELDDYLKKSGSAYDIESLRAAREAMDNPPVPHTVSPETAGVLPKAAEAVPETVTLYRGVKEGASVSDTAETTGNALFKSPDIEVARLYAGEKGTVQEQAHTFSNLLKADTWLKAKEYLGLNKADSMESLIKTAREKGYDGITFNTTNGKEYIVIPNPLHRDVSLKLSEAELDDVVGKLTRGEQLTADSTKGIDFNFSNIDAPEQIRSMLNTFSDSIKGAVAKTTRGKVSFEQIQSFADEIGSSAQNLEGLYKDTGVLAERVTAGRIMLNKSASALVDLAQRARELNISLAAEPEAKQTALLALRKQAMIHAEIQAQLKGTQTEIARAMSAMRIQTQDARFAKDELNTLIEHFGGDKLNIGFADAVVQLANDPAKLNKLIRKSAWVKTLDMLQEVFTNSILSGPITHATNILGNSIRAIAGTAETAIAAGIGKTRKMLGSELDAADFNEAAAQAHGLVDGVLDIVDLIRTGKISEVGQFGGNKTDGGAFFDPAITAGNMGLTTNSFLGRVATTFVNGFGDFIRLPGQALQFEDNIFKQINVRSSLRQNAYRQAKSEGLIGDDFAKRMAELINDPPPNLMTKAHEDALDAVFAKSLEKDGGALDRMGIWLQTAKNEGLNGRALVPGLHFIVPFIKTPTNIIKYAWDRMPVLGLINQQNISIMKNGGREMDLLLAKQTMGATALMIGSFLASQDMITGGLPQLTKGQKEVSGKQAYSVKIGDKWVAYNRVDPIGMFLGMAADFANLSGNVDDFTREELAYAAVSALGTNLASKTYLQGLFNTIGAISDATKGQTAGLEKWASSLINGFTPYNGLRNQGNKAFGDDVVRETNGLFDKWLATIPGFSQTLPPHRNLLTGEPVVYEGGMGVDIASPFYTKTEVNDPAANEISRLRLKFFQHPPKRRDGIDLTDEQYDRMMVLMTKDIKSNGETMHEKLNSIVTSPAWKQMSESQYDGDVDTINPGSKEYSIQQVFTAYKEAAWKQLLSEDVTLADKYRNKKVNKANTLLGIPVNQ